MKKYIFLAVMAILIAGAVSLFAQAVDVSGEWEITIDLGEKTVNRVYTFEQTGEKLIVKWTRKGENEQAEGTIKSGKIEWKEIANINGQEMEVIWTGTVEGNKMSGEQDFGGNASFPWTAVKKTGAQAVNISGKWIMTVEVPGSPQTQEIAIEQNGGAITVKWTSEGKEYKGEGTVKGNAVEWTMIDSSTNAEIKVLFTGTIATEGTPSLSGTFDYPGQSQKIAWKAVRKEN